MTGQTMAPNTPVGPKCNSRQHHDVNDGTLCRQTSAMPGPVGKLWPFGLTEEQAEEWMERSLGVISKLAKPKSAPQAPPEIKISDLPEYVEFVKQVLPNLLRTRSVAAHFQSSRGKAAITEVVIHSTDSGQPVYENTVQYLAWPKDGRDVSIHYIIGREAGQMVSMVPEEMKANQASLHNLRSIGIELWKFEKDKSDYTDWQYETVAQLVYDILVRRKIPRKNVIGHGEFEASRRGEPHGFDWPRFDDLLEAIDAQAKAFDPRFGLY
jgi:hypothetical protein